MVYVHGTVTLITTYVFTDSATYLDGQRLVEELLVELLLGALAHQYSHTLGWDSDTAERNENKHNSMEDDTTVGEYTNHCHRSEVCWLFRSFGGCQ